MHDVSDRAGCDLSGTGSAPVRGSLLKESDLCAADFLDLVNLAAHLKSMKRGGTEVPQLLGRTIALIFEKASTRTRCAFEVAAFDQGAHVTYLGPEGSHLGREESVRDTARVLGRMYDGIEFRGFAQDTVEELARYAGVPVWNGLTDQWHPTQMLADVLTMTEHHPGALDDIVVCYLGDARNNVARSLLVTGALLGMDVRVAAPGLLAPPHEVHDLAVGLATGSGGRVTVTDDPAAGVAGADFVYTDVWVSMGESAERWDERVPMLTPYRVTRTAPAHRQTGYQVPALPALDPRRVDRRRPVGAGPVRAERRRSGRRGVRVACVHRVRPGGEPHAHDQGGHGRCARRLRCASSWPSAAMRCCAAVSGRTRPCSAITSATQRAHWRRWPRTTTSILCHGNGPQVGLLALEWEADRSLSQPYPLDVLVAQTQGMIGYWLAQELRNAGVQRPVVPVITQTVVDADDPGFDRPTKFIGRTYDHARACELASRLGWSVARDGDAWRRVVASPEPVALVEEPAVRALVDAHAVVVCGGGGGVPVVMADGCLDGVEAVVDKDAVAALLAIRFIADRLLILTDVPALVRDFGTDAATPIATLTTAELAAMALPDGSMGPKAAACRRFTERPGGPV